MTFLTRSSAAVALLLIGLSVVGPRATGDDGRRNADKTDRDITRRIAAAQVPLHRIDESARQKVADLLDHASIYARGPIEAFPCTPAVYQWVVDHPHWGFRAWRALGVKCAKVDKCGEGRYTGTDAFGNRLSMTCVLREPGRRIWYGQGRVRSGLFSPPTPVRVLLLLRYRAVRGSDGQIGVQHRTELFADCDLTKTQTLLGRLAGLTPESAGNRVVEQAGLFFSGLAWHLSEHPEWARSKLSPVTRSYPKEKHEVDALLNILAAQ